MSMNQMSLQHMLMQTVLRMAGQPDGLNLQMCQPGSGGHVDLGASSTRFSPSNPTMMGHGDRTFKIADAPAAAPADPPPLASTMAHEKTQHALERAVVATLLASTDAAADRAAHVPPCYETLDDNRPDDEDESDGPYADDEVSTSAAASSAIVSLADSSRDVLVAHPAFAPTPPTTPKSLLAKMEAAMLNAHTARATKSTNYKNAMKHAAIAGAPSPALLAPPPAPIADGELIEPAVKPPLAAPKAKANAKAPPKYIMKRPAANSKTHIVNVPGVTMDDCFNELKKQRGLITRGAFTCRASDTAKRRCHAAGIDVETANAYARYNYMRASELYTHMKLAPPLKKTKS